jgi:hypothetical protein
MIIQVGGKLMEEKLYRVKVKDGDTIVELTGDKKFVVRSFNQVKSILNRELITGKVPRVLRPGKKPKTARLKKKPGRKPKQILAEAPVEEKPHTDLTKLSLPELFKVKTPKRENHRILLMAFYVNKVKGKREFKGIDLAPIYSELKLDVPKNLSGFLRRMAEGKEGLVVHGKKQGRYRITNKGIDFIHEMVPSDK